MSEQKFAPYGFPWPAAEEGIHESIQDALRLSRMVPRNYEHPETGEKILINEQGGHGSDIGKDYSLVPARAYKVLVDVLTYGKKKYAAWNWLNCPMSEHLNHAEGHLMDLKAEFQRQDNAIDLEKVREAMSHFFCRAAMAMEMYLRENEE